MAHLEAPKAIKTVEIVNPAEYVFPNGFKTSTKRQVWIDGQFKRECTMDAGTTRPNGKKYEDAGTYEERKHKHAVKFIFDWSGVNLQPLMERLTNTANSLIVTAQAFVRKNIESDVILESMIEAEKTYTFSVAELLEVRKSTPAITKGKRAINGISSKDELLELQKALEAKIAALSATK